MKFKYFIISIFLLASADNFAQQFNGGVSLGFDATQVAGDTYSGYDKAGLFCGGFVNLDINNTALIQFEMNYIQKGSRHIPDKIVAGDNKFIMNLGYVEVVVLYKRILSKKFILEGGLSLGILVHKKAEIDELSDHRGPFVNQDICTVVGLNYSLSTDLNLNFRTSNSIFSIRKEKHDGFVRRYTKEWGQYNDVLVLSLQYHVRRSK